MWQSFWYKTGDKNWRCQCTTCVFMSAVAALWQPFWASWPSAPTSHSKHDTKKQARSSAIHVCGKLPPVLWRCWTEPWASQKRDWHTHIAGSARRSPPKQNAMKHEWIPKLWVQKSLYKQHQQTLNKTWGRGYLKWSNNRMKASSGYKQAWI